MRPLVVRDEQSSFHADMTVLSEEAYRVLLGDLAVLRQENDWLRQQLTEAQAAALAEESSAVGSSLLHYVLDVVCSLLHPQRGQVIAVESRDAAGRGAPLIDIGPLQLALERPSLARAWQGQAVRLTTRYESVLWLPIMQGTAVAAILGLRRSPGDAFTSADQAIGAALAPLLISALQTGHRCFDLKEDHEALATVSHSLSTCIRGNGGRVAAMARDAERLAQYFALGVGDRTVVRLASIVHDIGTVDLAEDLMHREGRLTAAELAQVHEHPSFGAAIVQQLTGLEAVAPLVLAHHERWDGAGYPHGLAAGEIPLGARIIAVVDAFHAMTNPRTTRRPRTSGAAIAELGACAGTQFDRRVVEAFVRLLDDDTTGAQPGSRDEGADPASHEGRLRT